ncbi:hypothetical protein V5O48_017844 [Marasmius crinis-equi]|uniref:CxC2-like cysteine cluster KDZ transposase-associated domain-containing protein n=1 Tax=Marasmius crinis-equi TaxID=585013 RepID=A0ABR3EMV8_9AGAR
MARNKPKVVKVSNAAQRSVARSQPTPTPSVSTERSITTSGPQGPRTTVVNDAAKRRDPPTGSGKKRKAKKARHTYTSQGKSIHLSRFREEEQRETLLDTIISKEVDSRTNTECCLPGSKRLVQCEDCRFSAPTCNQCFVRNHKHCPLHWAQVWNNKFFDRQEPSSLGLDVFLGHNGEHCPLVNYSVTKPVSFTIMDCNGIHSTKVHFCGCAHSGSHMRQLLLARLFPATVDRPETAFTFELLEDYHLHTLASKNSAQDYMYAMRMKTDNRFPEKVKNPMQDFLRVTRLWHTLLIEKRSGQWHGLNEHFPLRDATSVSFPCFVCAEPGFNVPECWSEEEEGDVDDEFIHLASAFWSMDGHFGLQRKNKIDDPDDVSLLEGRGMFPEDEWFRELLSKHGKQSQEKSSCAKFKVIEMQNRLKFKGCVISGVVAVQCARHGIFMAATDLSLGETQLHVDIALASALNFVLARALCLTRFFCRVVAIYDIACQFSIHFGERIRRYLPEFGDVVDYFVWLVAKMHLDGHIAPCKYRYSLNYTQGCGRVDGEQIERTWPETKQAGGATREMNHGHRHDVLIDFWIFWNWTRLVRMTPSLYKKLTNARATLPKKIDYFIRLSVDAGQQRVSEWEKLSTEPSFDSKGEIKSVYRFDQAGLPSQESLLQDMLERERSRETKEESDAKGPEASFINQGLKLEAQQYELRTLVKKGETPPEDLMKKRESLRSRIRTWRKLQLLHMPGINNILGSLPFADPEDEELYLPSYFRDARYNRHTLGDTECKLRRGQAFDAISDLKYTLKHKRVLARTKRKESRGVKRNMRSTKFIRDVSQKADSWAEKYRRARERLINLGFTDGTDTSDFPALTDDAMYRPKIDGGDAALGEGSRVAGWIWRKVVSSDSLSPEQQLQAEDQYERVPWFRAKADMRRWLEEVELLEEEFRRLVRACDHMCKAWNSVANSSSAGHAAYAYHKADMFSQMSTEAREKLVAAGGGWPAEGQSLTEYLRSRRPRLSVDWAEVGAELKSAESLAGISGIQHDDGGDETSSDEDDDDGEDVE